MRIALSLAAALIATSAVAGEPTYLFDVVREKTHKISWDKLTKDVQPTPDWLLQFERNFDGVSGAMVDVTIDGKPYQVSYVCKPEACAAKKFIVLFDATGAHAFGALGGKNEPPAFFESPSQGEKDAMVKAFGG